MLKLKIFNNSGLGLVEMIVVVFMVGVIGLIIANLPASLKLIGSSKSESLAKEIAIKIVEDYRSKSFDTLSDGPFPINATNEPRLSKLPNGSGQVLVEPCPASICKNAEANIKKLTVTLNWISQGQNQNVELVTIITKGGL